MLISAQNRTASLSAGNAFPSEVIRNWMCSNSTEPRHSNTEETVKRGEILPIDDPFMPLQLRHKAQFVGNYGNFNYFPLGGWPQTLRFFDSLR